jgi:O-antigen/teichoic acid export membrane protein
MMRRFARDAMLYSLPTLVARAVGILLLPIYARHLGPADLGFVEYVAAFAVFALLLIPLEINQAMARLLPESDDPERHRSIIYSTVAFTAWVFLGVSILAYLLRAPLFRAAGLPDRYLPYVPGVLLYLATLALVSTLQTQFRFLQNVTAAVTMNVAIIILNLVTVVAFSLNGLTIGEYFISQTVSNAAGAVLALGFLARRFGRPWVVPRAPITREMLRYSTPILLSSFGVALSLGLDRILIGRYAGLTELGYYGVAARFGSIAAMAFTVTSSAMTPIVYRAHEDEATKRLVARLFHATAAFCIVVMALLSFFSLPLVTLLAGARFAPAAPFVFFLILSTSLSNMYIFFLGIDIAKDTRLISKINLSMGVISAIVSVVLIPLLGVWGAIVSAVIAAVVRLSLYVLFSQRLYRLPVRLLLPFSVVAALSLLNLARLS